MHRHRHRLPRRTHLLPRSAHPSPRPRVTPARRQDRSCRPRLRRCRRPRPRRAILQTPVGVPADGLHRLRPINKPALLGARQIRASQPRALCERPTVTVGEALHVPTSRRAVPQQEHALRFPAIRSCRTSTTPSLPGSTGRAPRRRRRRPIRRRETDRQLRRHVQRGQPAAPPDRSPQRCVQPVAPPCSARLQGTPGDAGDRDSARPASATSPVCRTRALPRPRSGMRVRSLYSVGARFSPRGDVLSEAGEPPRGRRPVEPRCARRSPAPLGRTV